MSDLDNSLPQCVYEPPAPEVERHEQRLLKYDEVLRRIGRETGVHCFRIHGINWNKLFRSPRALGALAPQVARDTLTRQAIRRRWANQKLRRSGHEGLLRAIGVSA